MSLIKTWELIDYLIEEYCKNIVVAAISEECKPLQIPGITGPSCVMTIAHKDDGWTRWKLYLVGVHHIFLERADEPNSVDRLIKMLKRLDIIRL